MLANEPNMSKRRWLVSKQVQTLDSDALNHMVMNEAAVGRLLETAHVPRIAST